MIQIILPISRVEYLKPVFDCLDKLERPDDTELLIITDGDEALQQAVSKKLDSINYKLMRVEHFGDVPAENINDRRFRISAIHNKIRNFIPNDCEYVFSLEDDTTYPSYTLTKMLMAMKDKVAFVEAVEVGRWRTPYIGGWKADNVEDPNEILSVMPSHGMQEIDAGGLYCALIDADLYKYHDFEPYDKEFPKGLSCDLNFGLYLRRKGYKCLIDWSIDCDHIGVKGSVNRGNTPVAQVRFSKENNNWTLERL